MCAAVPSVTVISGCAIATVDPLGTEHSSGHLIIEGSRIIGVGAGPADPSWRERADAYIAQLDDAPAAALIIAACDKVHNLSSILTDYDEVGDALWQRFNSGKESQRWWYWAVYETVQRRLRELDVEDLPVLDDYRDLLARFDAIGDA